MNQLLRPFQMATLLSFMLIAPNCVTAQLFRRLNEEPPASSDKSRSQASKDSRSATVPSSKPNAGTARPGTTNLKVQNQTNLNAKSGNDRSGASPRPGPSPGGQSVVRPQSIPRPGQTTSNYRPQPTAGQFATPTNSPPLAADRQSRPPASTTNSTSRQTAVARGRADNSPPIPQSFREQPVSQPQGRKFDRPQDLTGDSDAAAPRNPRTIANESKPNAEYSNEASDGIQVGDNRLEPAEALARFGIELQEQNDSVQVSRLLADGNGNAAGLQADDRIVSLGGAPLSKSSDFVEIARLLSLGDQIEIEFERNGVSQKTMIQYGSSPESSSIDANNVTDNGWSTTPNHSTAKLEKLVAEQQQLIAELQARIRQLESLNKGSF